MPPYERTWNLRQGFQRTGGLITDQVDGLYAERILQPGKYNNFYDDFRKLPQLNAVIDQQADVEAQRITNPDWEVTGNGAVSADATFNETGGINLVVPANDGDEVFLIEHQDANSGPLITIDWDNDLQPLFISNILMGPNVTTTIAFAGWKLTAVEPTATDNDQSFFRYEDDVNGGRWQAVTSVNGTDDAADTGVTVAVSTPYRLCIHFDANRVPRYYINGALVATGAARDAGDAIIPVMGVAADGAGTATQITVRDCFVSQLKG